MFFKKQDISTLSDAELAQRCQRLDPLAQRALYDRYKERVMGVCLRYFHRRELAEDVFQEGFTRFFQKIDRFDGQQPLYPYLKKVIIRAGLNYLRQFFSEKHAVETWSDALDNTLVADESLDLVGGTFDHLLTILRGMAEDDAVILQLALIESFSHDEIAQMLNITVGNSRARLFRARKKLMDFLMAEKANL